MKAAILPEINQAVTVQEVEKPSSCTGDVLVQIKAAALNHRDVFIQQGLYPGINLPAVLGSDGAGTVVDVGEGVPEEWLGNAVIINPSHNWGENPAFYSKHFKILGMPDHGTFSEYVKVEALSLIHI